MTWFDLLPGVGNLLVALRTANLQMAIGSASKNAREVVQRLPIASCIDALTEGDSVVRPTPTPDLFVYTAALVHVCAHACGVVEAAAAGIEAAKGAVGLGPGERVGQADVALQALSRNTAQHDAAPLTHQA